MTIKSIKHTREQRAHIPSREEAGVEDASPKVRAAAQKAEYPANPVAHRGQDPELFWLRKNGRDDREALLNVDIRSLYRHEHIAPATLIERLCRLKELPNAQLDLNLLFGNALDIEEIEKVSEYYRHSDGWTNRLIQGDSLPVMTSLLEREGMAGKVPCVYFDPPCGIRYGKNWQMKLNNRSVSDSDDADLSGEPEQIKACRDTWELGIHSYLSHLRDRLLVAKELPTESGSCFVQISDENVHLVRCIMNEVFGSENFKSPITFKKTAGLGTEGLAQVSDYILWYSRDSSEDIRQDFIYRKVPHVTLKSIANDEPADEETLFDQPEADRKKLRVAGPFTVETLQSFEPVPPEALDRDVPDADELESFEERIFEHLKSAGVRNGIRNKQAVFVRVDRLASGYLHAEGFYQSARGERKAYLHIGPKYGTVIRQAVHEAVKECRLRGDADWLIILGFSFESAIENRSETTSHGSFEITKVRMHDDLMQDGLLKRDKKAASFVTIGEPDIVLVTGEGTPHPALSPKGRGDKKGKGVQTSDFVSQVRVEIRGLDIYDPIRDEVRARNVADIACWMVDDDNDGSNFVVRQAFFCGGDKDEFLKWRKGLANLAADGARKRAEKTLKVEIDEEAFARLYGHLSHPVEVRRRDQRIAVRVISQFGEECTKILAVEPSGGNERS